MIARKVAWLILMMSPLLSNAQITYTLDQCVELALTENLNIKGQQQQQFIYEEQINEVKRTALPNISVGANYNYYTELPTSVAPAASFAPNQDGFIPLQLGLPHQSTYALQLNQVIYNPTINIGLKAAEVTREIGQLELKRVQEQTIYQVAANYYNAQAITKQIEMLESNSLSLDTLIKNTQLLEETGLAKSTDVGRLKLSKANIDNNIANLEANLVSLINNLKLLTNLPSETAFNVVNELAPEHLEIVNNAPSNIGNRTELQLLKQQQEVLILQEKQIQAGALPHLYGVANYGLMGQGDLSEDFYEHYGYGFLGLQLNWSIFDGQIRKSQKKQKQLQQKQLITNMKMTQRSIENEHATAVARLNVQIGELQTQKQSIDLANATYENIQLQYKEGLVGVQEIIESENELTRTQTNYLNSWIRLQQAQLDLAQANGSLLTRLQ